MYSLVKFRTSTMFHGSRCACDVFCRYLSSAEISTALRPFYFSVHPDLFGKYPEQRQVNEQSLQQLSALLEAQQCSRSLSLPPLSFYIRQKDMPEGKFNLVKIQLSGGTVRDTVKKVLISCDISTEYVDKIPIKVQNAKNGTGLSNSDFAEAFKKYNEEFESIHKMKSKIEKKKSIDNLIDWIDKNSDIAKQKYESTAATRQQVASLAGHLRTTYGIKEVKWDEGWNISHIRGALQSLVALATQHSQDMTNLEGRTIALGQFTGVSLDGDVFLNIVDVRHEWLSLIKKITQEDNALAAIPTYEKTLSSILRDIHIRRRKFMPKVSATQYVSHLRRLVTSVGDFYGAGRRFPASVPASLSKYEIVVEPEAGPLMVSPTGQFIAPASCPAEELVAYMGQHVDEATRLMTEYSINKHVEKALHAEVRERLGLLALHKDDSVTPALMIQCCERLLTRCDTINAKLRGNILNITHYYSVLSEGALCIPWNFK